MPSVRETLEEWGFKLVSDMKSEIDKELGEHGGGQKTSLSGSVKYQVLKSVSGYTFTLSMNDYWKYVESGRKKGAKGVPQSVLGKKWQNSKGINPSKIIYEMTVKYNAKKGLKRKVKKLPFEKASRQLAFLIQRSIKAKGIEPHPFFDKVFNQERLNQLTEQLKPVIKQEIIFDIKKVLNVS